MGQAYYQTGSGKIANFGNTVGFFSLPGGERVLRVAARRARRALAGAQKIAAAGVTRE
jgi:hypothetical protein